VVAVRALASDVAVAQVRQFAIDDEGREVDPAPATGAGQPFSELALYVLVELNGWWWVAAGHNTAVRPGPNGDGRAT
jgi:hypothetical protein